MKKYVGKYEETRAKWGGGTKHIVSFFTVRANNESDAREDIQKSIGKASLIYVTALENIPADDLKAYEDDCNN